MAMYVLLRFENDDQALTLIEDMQEYSDADILTPTQENNVHATVEALYKAPTMFHEPFETHGAKKTEAAFTMGQKWGWWVCSVCKKPSRMYWDQIVKKQSSFGKNILSMFFTEESSN